MSSVTPTYRICGERAARAGGMQSPPTRLALAWPRTPTSLKRNPFPPTYLTKEKIMVLPMDEPHPTESLLARITSLRDVREAIQRALAKTVSVEGREVINRLAHELYQSESALMEKLKEYQTVQLSQPMPKPTRPPVA